MNCHISKEIFDKVVAFVALIILLPIFLVAVLIEIDSKCPVFFMQQNAPYSLCRKRRERAGKALNLLV
jgi:lipopolysaccharide/colanic/teichoic acid biosynthesis glycosyltransferase